MSSCPTFLDIRPSIDGVEAETLTLPGPGVFGITQCISHLISPPLSIQFLGCVQFNSTQGCAASDRWFNQSAQELKFNPLSVSPSFICPFGIKINIYRQTCLIFS